MHLLLSFLLLCGLVCSFVSAGPSPQWLYEQIHALPDTDNDHEATELHIKKSNIPDKNHALLHKRKDGVKRLFNFLDSAIQDSGSGSGEGSGHEQVAMVTEQQNSGSTGLTGRQSTGSASSKQQTTTTASSSDRAQHKTEAQGASVQVSSNTDIKQA
ncbi:hypothetical protein OS493_026675 [Desmophyllum pertusum]|uniref:Uncharacterized protein n=1 Tax=Desmophyllum pertusum TaxID=174260 RepID=A0A9W9ZYG3_9CNID|nr:hypothetical protein OS493_026675 [Desmophyllum pertusum]